jgi:hypothetical protein
VPSADCAMAIAEADPAPKARAPRIGTKQEELPETLCAEGGATIDEIAATTGWQPHPVMRAIAGALKKRFGSRSSRKRPSIRLGATGLPDDKTKRTSAQRSGGSRLAHIGSAW